MESRNPENEAPDNRMLSEKVEDEGKAPELKEPDTMTESDEPKEQPTISDEQANQMMAGCQDVDALIAELNRFEIKSLNDVKRVRQIMNDYELGKIYGN